MNQTPSFDVIKPLVIEITSGPVKGTTFKITSVHMAEAGIAVKYRIIPWWKFETKIKTREIQKVLDFLCELKTTKDSDDPELNIQKPNQLS